MVETRKNIPENVVLSLLLRGFVPDIFKACFDLKRSFKNQLSLCTSESKLLAYAFFISIILFLERLPGRVSHYNVDHSGEVLFSYVGIDLFASIYFVPIFVYFLASLAHVIAYPFKGRASFFEARLAFFWAIIVASPILLLNGLLQGFFSDFLVVKLFYYVKVFGCAWIFSVIFCEAEGFSSNWGLFSGLLAIFLFLSFLIN